MKDKIARWFYLGLWSEAMVLNAATKGVITEDEAKEILSQEV